MLPFYKELFISLLFFFLYLLLPGLLTCLSFNIKQKSLLFILIAGFCLSLVLNHAHALITILFDLRLSSTLYLLLCYSFLILVIRFSKISFNVRALDYSEVKYIFLPCLILFFIMLINGGLIAIHSDAWWHMSYATKISESNQIFLERSHLSGIEIENFSQYFGYLPGWHLILALLHQSSGLPLVSIWYNLASFLVPLTFISYFLFAKSLSQNNSIALLSAILLSLLFGGLNSYFRTSPWPGNVSYIIWYFLYALTFSLLIDFSRSKKNGFFSFLTYSYKEDVFIFFLTTICSYLILTIHASEILWFAVSFIFYYLLAIFISPMNNKINSDLSALTLPVATILCLASVAFLYKNLSKLNLDLAITGLQFIALLVLGYIFWKIVARKNFHLIYGLICLFIFTAFNIDFDQLKNLFHPVTNQLNPYGFHHPYDVTGIFGDRLLLPQWKHQLREGILLAGIISIFASCYLCWLEPNRAKIYLCANCYFSFLVITSPYLFTFVNYFTPYTSTYRVHLLIFHPIILAFLFHHLYSSVLNESDNKNQ